MNANHNGRDWVAVTHNKPCPACGKPDWCAWTRDQWLKCERATEAPAGMVRAKLADAGALFRPLGDDRAGTVRLNGSAQGQSGGMGGTARKPSVATDWAKEAATFTAELTAERRAKLAADLGVSDVGLAAIGCGWAAIADLRRLRASGAGWQENYPDGAFTFPERDAGGRIVGVSLRAADGRKGFPAGAKRGLIVPSTLKEAPDPVLIVEGASDVAACCTLGLAAVGRPSNSGGADLLATMLDGRKALVIGERDQKEGGLWPGREGAKSVAGHLSAEWDEKVPWTLPPEGIKDIRAELLRRTAAGLDIGDQAACKAAGAEILAALTGGEREAKPKRERPPTDAELIVRLALERFRLGRTEGDEPFAVRLDGPCVAIMLRGSKDALRGTLANEFRTVHNRTPSQSALADAMTTLQGIAQDRDPEPVFLRVAELDGAIVLDLGGADGRAVIVRPGIWEVVDSSPVLFRRTALTAVLPEPERGGSLDSLRALLNVSGTTWPLLVGFMVAALVPAIPHPILMLGGLQGTGKTTAAVFVAGLFDPCTADNHNVPRDPEAWAMAASGSWGVTVDNVSGIPEWWSDALCKAVTGAGWVRRKLYSDSDLSVLTFRRVVILTSIDTGALRGDLGDRLVIVDLEPIPDDRRRSEKELRREYAERRPAILGAFLDLAAAVLRELPAVELAAMPRMADFARILAAMDKVLGTDALGACLAQRSRIADDVVESDPVGAAIVTLMKAKQEWIGTAAQLWRQLTPMGRKPDGWPRSGRGLAGRLRRLIPALALVGVECAPPHKNDKTRRYVLRSIAPTAQPPGGASDSEIGTVASEVGAPTPKCQGDGASVSAPCESGKSECGLSGGAGDPLRPISSAPGACRSCKRSRWWRFPEDPDDRDSWTCGVCSPPVRTDVVWSSETPV